MLTHRERVLRALSHEEPDRVPLDLGATRATGISVEAYTRLVNWLGLADEIKTIVQGDARIRRPSRLAQVDEMVLVRLGVDLRGLVLDAPDNWRDLELDEFTYQDQWGIVRRGSPHSEYRTVVHHPLGGDVTIADIVHYQWPDATDRGPVRGLREKAWLLRGTTDYALVLHLGDMFVHQSQYMRGFEDWSLDLALNPDRICTLMDAVLDIRLETARQALNEVGDLVDVVQVADDVADSRGPLISPRMFRRYIKPRFARFLDLVRSLTPAKILFHSCGAVFALLPDFIDLGIDAVNPVQVSSQNMDTSRLKESFGEELVFWGGIDSQRVLPYGSAEDVRAEVQRRIRDLAPSGGYVLCSVHNIQPDVPPGNVWTMYQAALEMGHYPVRDQTHAQ